ncbi:MAG: Gfo/Idh/MocA family oxidoreductase [Ruminococcus flavefaciens]|nr:Gfo/Idh/MocA family oxidoreductase [Ruminococcus flavefaciens]
MLSLTVQRKVTSKNNSASEPVSVIMIGAGNRARKYLEYILANPRRIKVFGVVDPNELRRNHFADRCSLGADALYSSSDALFAGEKKADAVIIASPDSLHYTQTMQAISKGYHVLLEKPIAQSDREARDIQKAAAAAGVIVNVCYVLHFHPYFMKLHELVHSGKYGRIVSVSHTAPVGIDRATHVYVRGIWNQKGSSGPLFTSKCCHDLDLMLWLTGGTCTKVSSYGSLRWFTRENAPEGSANRCIRCSIEKSCPYSAVDLYRNRHAWISNFDVQQGETINDTIERELATGRYGRCVYHCENDVVDRQVVAMEMESGVTVDFMLDVFTTSNQRRTNISLTEAEIIGDERSITINTFRPRVTTVFDFRDTVNSPYHAGADLRTVENFVDCILGCTADNSTSIEHTVESQALCQAIEDSRIKP